MPKSRVLVIEDNVDNLELVEFLLLQAGYEVLKAVDGKQGLEIARRELPDLVLLDLTLPLVDGWQLASQLKADPQTKGLYVVALTAHTLPGDRKRALESGCDAYISKPLDIPNFTIQVEGFLARKGKAFLK